MTNAMMRRSTRNLDDEDEDINDFDPAYFPKRVYKDGRGPRVRLMLTAGMPDWMPPRRALYDASAHRPHYAEITDAAANRRAVAAYEAHNKWLQDAWRGPANPPPPDDEDDGDESPRDAYIRRLGTAYRTPIGNGAGADAIEAQRRRWTREDGGGGRAPSGVTFGQHAPSAFPSRDAASLKDARADADQAHAEMVHRLQNAWRR